MKSLWSKQDTGDEKSSTVHSFQLLLTYLLTYLLVL